MKKVIVISDSHGNKDAIDKIFNNFQFDYLLFLGDGIADLGTYIYDERVKVVRGNCDFFSNEKTDGFIQIEDVLIFYTHGHKYSVKNSTLPLLQRLDGLKVNIALYGHTHKYNQNNINNTLLINAPALSNTRGGENAFILIEIDKSNFSIQKISF